MNTNESKEVRNKTPYLAVKPEFCFTYCMSSATQQYLAFVLFPDRAAVVLWQQSEGGIHLLAQSNVIQAGGAQERDLSTAIDSALDQLGETGLSVKNALFLVPSSWVENGDLAEKRKRFLKTLTHDLMLEPLGYVVLTDTLLANEAAKSPKPFSGLLVFDTSREWILEEVKQGFSLGFQTVGKSQDLAADAIELASRLQTVSHRERVLLVPLDPVSQSTSEETLEATLQVPLERLLPEELVKISVQLGGKEILHQLPTPLEEEEAASGSDQPATLAPADDLDFQPASFSAGPSEANGPPENSGEESPTVWDVEPEETNQVTEMSPAGFVIHRSVQDFEEGTVEASGAEETPLAPRPKRKKSFTFPRLRLPFLTSLGKMQGKKKKIVLALASILILTLGGLGVGYVSFARSYTATATIWLAPQRIEQSFAFVAGAPSASASGALPLPGEIITETATVETESPTTGTKITGDPATGTVTITNKTSQEKTFTAGTKLKSGEQEFEFTQEVKVPGEEEDEDGSTFGKADAAVKAVAIGTEGNLEKNTSLTVSNFDKSSYEAKVKDTFTGGTQREIQAVSQQDIDQAAQQLRQAANEKIAAQLEEKQKDGNTVFPSKQVTIRSIQATPQVGEEAKFVKVTVTADSPGLLLTAEQTTEKGRELLASQIGESHDLLTDTVDFQAKDVSVIENGKTFIMTAQVSGETVPRLQAEALTQEIKGTYINRATTLLGEKTGVARQEVKLEPSWLQWLFPQLPNDPARIRFNIKLDRNQ